MNNLSNVSEIQVLYRPRFKASERPQVSKSTEAYHVLKSVWDLGLIQFTEEFKVILLNNSNRVLGVVDIAKGGKDYVPVDVRVIFSIALKVSASKIILAHNHPSGKLVPSREDRALTTKVKEAGKLLDIEVCDHLIMTSDGYYSFADKGQLSLN